jgi:LysR family transcriptional regulator, hydrogen peroxide-inducible genes activator
MNDFTLKQLRYASAVASERHFGRAAMRCHITQSALSQQILALEEHCGTPIFLRLGKTVRLTPFGCEFITRALPVLSNIDALNTFATSHEGKPGQPLRFGIIPTIAPYLLPDIFPVLSKEFPDTKLTVSENQTDQLLDGLAQGELDMALIATDPPKGMRLTVADLFFDPFVLAIPASEEPVSGPVKLDQINPGRLLLLDEGHCLRDQALEACALSDPQEARNFAATSLSTIVELVANGQGVTLLPAISLHKEAANPSIIVVPLAAPGAARHLKLVWHQASPFTELFHQIAEVIRGAGKKRLASALHTGAYPG